MAYFRKLRIVTFCLTTEWTVRDISKKFNNKDGMLIVGELINAGRKAVRDIIDKQDSSEIAKIAEQQRKSITKVWGGMKLEGHYQKLLEIELGKSFLRILGLNGHFGNHGAGLSVVLGLVQDLTGF